MTQQKEGQLSVVATVKKMEPELALLLKATGTDKDKFMNNAIMALNEKPEIAAGQVDRKSVYNVCSRAANDGLVLDNVEAALILGSVKRNGEWVKEAQYRRMAGGVMKMINRSPNIERVVCQLIYENDDFLVDFVTPGESVAHKITPESLKKGRGEIVGVYFTAKLANGEWSSPEVMSVAEVNAVRDSYAKKDKDGKFSGMWENSWGEAARKTVLHRARKRLPLDGTIVAQLDAEESGDDNEVIDHDTGEVLNQTQPETQPAEPKKAQGGKVAAAAVKAAVKKTVVDQPAVPEGKVIDVEAQEFSDDNSMAEDEEIPI